ncbi:hypothetical protein X975_16956, partial [Stegodyphus mimosarum]
MSSDESDNEDIPEVAECERLVQEFAKVTGTDTACAQFYLQDRKWNLDVNMYKFLVSRSICYFVCPSFSCAAR